MNNKYKSILSELSKERETSIPMSTNSRVLIVDGLWLNTFIRSFSVDPSSNENGVHVGGITGFLKSIGYAIKIIAPTRVIIVFDGKGGSQRRRKIYPEYKATRKVNQRYNRAIHISGVEDEKESMKMQLGRLLNYLEKLPLKIITIDNIEADDTIAYLTRGAFNTPDTQYYIMSSDKDFYQLVNENTYIWSPTKKRLYDKNGIYEEYGINSNNFIMYRILDGDVSDNIPGIRGVGLKTIKNKLPILTETEKVDINKLIEYSSDKTGKIYESIINSKSLLERNFQLMQLEDVDISAQSKLKIIESISSTIPTLNAWDFKIMVLEDYINGAFPNLEFWLKECFQQLNMYGLKYAK